MLDQILLELDREGIKEREDGERGRGRLFEGGDYFKYSHQMGEGGGGGNYSREVINIEGRLLFEEIRYLQFCRNVLYRLDP